MDKTISEQLDEVFHVASQTYVRKLLTTARDLAAFDAIKQRAAEKQEELNRLYDEEYPARLETTRQRLYDEAAQIHLDHPAPSGSASTSDERITQIAHGLVQLDHQVDQQMVRDEAQQAFEDLLDAAHSRGQAQDKSRNAFTRAGERRSGEDRRTRNQSQD